MTRRLSSGFVLLILASSTGCQSRPHGRYEDRDHNFIDFEYSGHAYTNIDAGGSEARITFERDRNRVVLHQLDGNPVLSIQPDGSLCCGPAGVLRPLH